MCATFKDSYCANGIFMENNKNFCCYVRFLYDEKTFAYLQKDRKILFDVCNFSRIAIASVECLGKITKFLLLCKIKHLAIFTERKKKCLLCATFKG